MGFDKELIVIDEATVKFVLKEPFGAFINDVPIRAPCLRAGQAQYIYPMPPELLKVVENDKNIDIIKQPSIVERYMILNIL